MTMRPLLLAEKKRHGLGGGVVVRVVVLRSGSERMMYVFVGGYGM